MNYTEAMAVLTAINTPALDSYTSELFQTKEHAAVCEAWLSASPRSKIGRAIAHFGGPDEAAWALHANVCGVETKHGV